MKFLIATFLLFLTPVQVFSTGEEKPSEETSTRFGPGKAVEAFDKEEGFKLSEKAMKTLGVGFSKLDGGSPWRIPKEALVRIKQSDAVYRRYEGWISLVLVKVVGQSADSIIIASEDLETGDEVGTKGAQYLRMTDADLNSGTVDSCSH